MANKRTFLVQGLKLNNIDVGGLASLGFSGGFSTVRGRPDGGFAVEEVSRAGLSVGFNVDCADVQQVNAILAAAKADTLFYSKESGTTTYHKYTLPNAVAWCVLNSMNLSLSSNADGQLSLGGKVSFVDGSKTLADALTLVAAQAAPTLVHPLRLAYPNLATFDPTGAPPVISPLHTSAISLSLQGETVESFADADLSSVVDFVGWGPLQVSWTFQDATVVSGSHIAAQLLAATYGVLSVPCQQLGGQAAKTLTVNNVLWTGVEQRERKEHTEFTMRGEAGWRSAAGTAHSMNAADKLFSFA